jgi:hypothetical protein
MEASRALWISLPSTARKRSFFTVPIMSSPMNPPILISRNSASKARSASSSEVSGNSIVRCVPLYCILIPIFAEPASSVFTRSCYGFAAGAGSAGPDCVFS